MGSRKDCLMETVYEYPQHMFWLRKFMMFDFRRGRRPSSNTNLLGEQMGGLLRQVRTWLSAL